MIKYIFLYVTLLVMGVPLQAATNYYVTPDGSDGADGTTPGTAFKTLGKAAGLVNPGDSVLVADGTYDGVSLNQSGSSSGWIVFRSINTHGAQITNAGGGYACFAVYSQYVELNGFEVTNPQGHGISAENASHVRVVNCHCHHCYNSGITGAWGDFYHFEGNVCHHNALGSWYSNISIYEAKDIGDDSPGYHIIIRNNICYSAFQSIGPFTDGNGIIIDDWNYTQNAGTPYPYTALVENNLCYNNGGAGVKCCWSDHVTFRNNSAFWNNRDNKNTGTYRGDLYSQQSRDCKWINNIGIANKDWNSNNTGMMDKGTPSGNSTTDNIWANNIVWDGSGVSVSTGDGCSPVMSGNLGVDPQFAAPGTLAVADFHLAEGSPGINAGTDTYGYPDDDLEGTSRPQETGVDIGCYEYSGAGVHQGAGLVLKNVYPQYREYSITGTGQLPRHGVIIRYYPQTGTAVKKLRLQFQSSTTP